MPGRLALSAEEALERIREQTRARVKRYRERRNAAANATEPPRDGNVTPPPGSPSLLKKRKTEEKEAATVPPGVAAALGSLAGRVVYDPCFWALLARRYPDVDLELEAHKLVDWLTQPRNTKRRCSKTFVANWLRKAAADGPGSPPGRMVVAGTYAPPPGAPLRLPGPLERVDLAEAARILGERGRIPLQEKLAAMRNGRQG